MRPPSNITAVMSAGIKKIAAGILTDILTRMPVRMHAVILMSGAAAYVTSHLVQLSLPSFRIGKSSTGFSFWGLGWVCTYVEWHVISCGK